MARKRRLQRDMLVDIDTQALLSIAVAVGANHKQYRSAYSRALQRTAVTLRKQAMANIKMGLAPRSLTLVRQRLLSFRYSRGATLDEAKLWFGLNAIKVKDLKGRIRGRIRPHHSLRDPKTGRYSPARRSSNTDVGFEPKGSLLESATFLNGEVARARGNNRRTVVIRDPQTRRTKEAEVDIYAPMLDYIEDNAFSGVVDIFMHHFQSDIKGRVKAKIS
ncbi:hypothetical protein HGT71_05950 [Rosenbergiella epipactidis]|uniref:hypothetical protein n=1 Tax=Rosenbergiella epipactidis TaxID=1544694 RepID=UPI001BD93DC0|nr:hypothetical protein [Rosenbergiella epipactidis]MBT0717815.1 hypothetical protein [Rosenbergiella epipactidis]